MFEVTTLEDTVFNDKRITTLVAKYPRIIHAEVLTHRAFCRNSSSSRAIPARKMIADVAADPFYPLWWGLNQKGMSMSDEQANIGACRDQWRTSLDAALMAAKHLSKGLDVHKSLVNRLLEPFSYITCLITATEWANFFRLRIHEDADPHMHKLAAMMFDAIEKSEPVERPLHLPFLRPTEQEYALKIYLSQGARSDNLAEWAHVSAARCARVSYLTHMRKNDRKADKALAGRLVQGSGFGHWSPFEHFAISYSGMNTKCPYRGWRTFRAMQLNENMPGHAEEYRCLKKS